MSKANSQNKFVKFLKNNTALLVIIFCALAIAVVVTVVALTSNNSIIDDDGGAVINPDDDNTDNKPTIIKVYYKAPVAQATIGMGYTDGEELVFVFNSTLNMWKTHNALDLLATEGTAVTAMFDGTVIAVDNTYAMGNSVTVDHGNGVVATYASLGDVDVVKGQVLSQGDQIGTVGTSASNEFKDGAHLHLEVKLNDKVVDPTPYVNGEKYVEIEQDNK